MEKKTIMLIAEENREAMYEKLNSFAENAEVGDMLYCIDLKLRIVEFVPLRSEKQHYRLMAIYKAYWSYVLYLDTEFSFVTDKVPMLPCEADVHDNRTIWKYMADNHAHYDKYAAMKWELYDASSFDDWSLSLTRLSELKSFLCHDIRSLYLDDGEANIFIDFIGKASPVKGTYYNVMAMFWHNDTIVAITSIPEMRGILYPISLNKELNIN